MTDPQHTARLDSRSASKLRIGVVTAFPPGRNSLNEFGFHLVKHLSRLDEVESVVVFADETDAGDPDPMPGVQFVSAWRFNSLSTVFRLTRSIVQAKPDAVVLNLQFATFGDRRIAGALGLLVPAVLRARKIPTLLILHNLADNVDMKDAGFAGSPLTAWLMTKAGRILTRALLRADLVALTIPRYVEFLQSSYGATNAILAPHGSFDEIPQPVFTAPPGRRSILAFGKWGTYKTVDLLVHAYKELLDRGYTDISLVLAGTDSPNSAGYMASAEERFSDVPNIEMPGYISEDEVSTLFLSATVVAFPYTSTTGSSGVLHQAGEYGRAAVIPRIGDLVDIIEEEGFRGVYFEPGDATSLADALAEVLDDPVKQGELGRRNYAAATGIPMSEVVQWHIAHIERLLEKRARR
ncbi:glycosyltransferase [Subtercola sp. PAMC28395]|uniref:glycosyltransferase n=1 Tax=Subtercola sp. PAMC28395 TaxID=2846775 RepID=UPI001C0B45E5|nr:glycosyltransferase [Subtercola sp. PAMC28395]QWT24311.1 glycosyltransferase [Subtercola sp. PAMC28395]